MKSRHVRVLLLIVFTAVFTYLGLYNPFIKVSAKAFIGFSLFFGFGIFSSYLFGTEDAPNEEDESYKLIPEKKVKRDFILWPVITFFTFFFYNYVLNDTPIVFLIKFSLLGALQLYIATLYHYELDHPGFTVHRMFKRPFKD